MTPPVSTTEEATEAAEHFQDLATQHQASELGMWVFLGSETLLFGALFGLFTAFVLKYPDVFQEAASHNNMVLGSVMTLVLITSSFFVAWAVHESERNARKRCLASLALVLLLGLAFLSMKGYEYVHHFNEGVRPGRYYEFATLPSDGARAFFTLYYAMTALHALHVLAGLAILVFFAASIARRSVNPKTRHGLRLGGLYWHLVDIIWIFLWPLLYLA